MIRKGEEWGAPAGDSRPDLDVAGDDATLAAAVADAGPDPLVRFFPAPASDLARAVGLAGAGTGALVLPLDLLRLDDGGVAVNAVVVGVPPDRLRWWHPLFPVEVLIDGTGLTTRATSVVVTTGQFLRGVDVSPRGHPGDGWCEVQVYALAPGQRRLMRARLRSGSHLPHPQITTRRGRSVSVRCGRAVPLEVDGNATAKKARAVSVEVVPAAYRLLI